AVTRYRETPSAARACLTSVCSSAVSSLQSFRTSSFSEKRCPAPQPQTSSQRRQPVHFFSSTVLFPKKSETRSVYCRLSASNGQMLIHSPQPHPMHFSSL